MAMGMVITPSNKLLGIGLIYVTAAAFQPACAGDWQFTPSFSLSERYSDNVNLSANGSEQSSFVTEATPSIRATRNGARVKANVNYSMHGRAYTSSSVGNSLDHKFNGSLKAELSENFLFLDANADVSQQYRTLTGALGADAINTSSNLANVVTYSITPYIKTRLGSYANLDFRLTHSNVSYESAGATDSSSNGVNFSLTSGSRMLPVSWALNFRQQNVDNKTTVDTESEYTKANLRYPLSRRFGLTAQANNERNDYLGATGRQRDFTSWGGGAYYEPSRRLSTEIAYNSSDNGGFWSGSLSFRPTLRTSLTASTTQRSFGRTYDLGFKHRTRKSSWGVQYREDLTTTRDQLLSPIALLDVYDCSGTAEAVPTGTPPPNPTCVLAGQIYGLTSTDFNTTFLSKSLNSSVSYRMRRSTATLSLFSNERDSQPSGATDRTDGLQMSLSIIPATRTTYTLSSGWTTTQSSAIVGQDDLWNISLSVSRRFQPKVSGSLQLRHQQRESVTVSRDYEENSVAANLNMSF